MKKLQSKLKELQLRDVSFGYRTVSFGSPDLLTESQIGYARTERGENLCGEPPEHWDVNWVVIGRDEEIGDPIFVDISDSNFPVYTAMHGEGEWIPSLIADSLAGFASAMGVVAEVSTNRENPAQLGNNPLPREQIPLVLNRIASLTGAEEESFWEAWFEDL